MTPPDAPQTPPTPDPEWMSEFDHLADNVLGADDDGSACEQVHPVVAAWYERALEGDPPESRPSVWQAMSCLATELLADADANPELAPLLEAVDEDALATWVEHVLLVGRAFEQSLSRGDLDDL